MQATAGIIIIGNEILSGKFRDDNAFFLLSELRSLGVEVRKISVIMDIPSEIGREVADFSQRFEYVFTSGGIGPTHDDVTMEGIALGFGVPLATDAVLERHIRTRYGDRINESALKMARVPEGAEILDIGSDRFPLVAFRNVFVLPGIPQYLRIKFDAVRERFRNAPFSVRRIYLRGLESDIAAHLDSVVAGYPEVSFGSYPILENPDYSIIVTAESRSAELLEKAVSELLRGIPEELLVRTE